jgi:hypothetical protein
MKGGAVQPMYTSVRTCVALQRTVATAQPVGKGPGVGSSRSRLTGNSQILFRVICGVSLDHVRFLYMGLPLGGEIATLIRCCCKAATVLGPGPCVVIVLSVSMLFVHHMHIC